MQSSGPAWDRAFAALPEVLPPARQVFRPTGRYPLVRAYLITLVGVLLLVSIRPTLGGNVPEPEQKHAPAHQGPYIFPFLRWGPNNQKRDLRHVLALAKALDAGIVLTGIYKHYSDSPSAPPAPASALPPTATPPAGTPSGHRAEPHQRRILASHARHRRPSSQWTRQLGDTGAKGDPQPSGLVRPWSPLQEPDLRYALESLGRLGGLRGMAASSHHTHGHALKPADATYVDNGAKAARAKGAAGPADSVAKAAERGGEKEVDEADGWQVAGGRANVTARKSCFSEATPLYMPFSEVLDREPLTTWVPTVTVSELKEHGWDGVIDGLVRPALVPTPPSWTGNKYVDRALLAEGVQLQSEAPSLEVSEALLCDSEQVAVLKEFVHRHKVVGLQIILLGYELESDLEEEAKGPNTTDPDKQTCHDTLHKANELLRPAPWIRELAQRYIHNITGFGTQPFLAIHVRPFPDECLNKWRYGRFEPTRLAVLCTRSHTTLHLKLARCVLKTLLDNGLRKLFVMTHPLIRAPVGTMITLAGFTESVFLEAHHVHRLADCGDMSSTFLSMVEEEISVQASHFIGTSLSSITHTIAYQRMGAGHSHNMYFENLKC